ncbi:MAG: hypothetical protein C0432_03965 [Candidatus Puniceispirillum sp.]|nr:hypothetical protein [Candidatus Pelagibacter sp.]MBA4283431.1 hypothetical protein [Candidatus Puniceispirillum sp.]
MHNDFQFLIVIDCADEMVFKSKKDQSPTEEVVINIASDEPISLGEKLKEQRLKLGLTIEDVCAKTKIRKAFIIAIENNNLDILPGKVYVHGFLNNYVKLLGLPADIITYELSCVEDIKKDNQPPFKFYVYSEKSYSITTKTVLISLLLLLCVLAISKLTEEKPKPAIKHNDSYSIDNNLLKPTADPVLQKKSISDETQAAIPTSDIDVQNKADNTKIDSSENQVKTTIVEDLSSSTASLMPTDTNPVVLPKIDVPVKAEGQSKYIGKDLNLDEDDDD